MVSHLKKVLMKKPQNFMSKVDLQKWNYTSPLDQEILYEDYNEFYKIVKRSGAEIVDLKLRNENEELCDSVFTHDPSLVLNDGAIILNMGKDLRKKETEEHTNFYNEEKIPIIGKVIKDLYLFDFIGCDIYFNNDYIGIVKDVLTFSGNDLFTRSIYSEEWVLIKKDWSNLAGFFQINSWFR